MNMTDIYDIIQELNLENGSKYKIGVLKKYADNELLKRVLDMTYDHVKYNYGIGKKTLGKISYPMVKESSISIERALDILENSFCTRDVTGNAAINRIQELFNELNDKDRLVITRVIERDLKINLGKTQINKVFKGLITKPIYMRCDVYNKKSIKNVKFPAIVQLKADGLACFTHVTPNEVICYTRSGESFKLNSIQYLSNKRELHNKIIQGELLIEGELDRSISNGEINSLIKFRQGNNSSISDNDADIIESRLLYQVWDIITESERLNAQNKIKCNTPYKERFEEILGINWSNGNI